MFVSGVGKRRLSIPNYGVFTRDGTLYVSDSGAFGKVNGKILQFDKDHSGRGRLWHNGPFNFANGLALSPNEDALFVVCSWLPGVERIEIKSTGEAGLRSVYARTPKTVPDGLAFDKRGNLYMSCYTPNRIYKIDPHRNVRVFVEDWEAHTICNPTNIAFGGPRFDQLLVSNPRPLAHHKAQHQNQGSAPGLSSLVASSATPVAVALGSCTLKVNPDPELGLAIYFGLAYLECAATCDTQEPDSEVLSR